MVLQMLHVQITYFYYILHLNPCKMNLYRDTSDHNCLYIRHSDLYTDYQVYQQHMHFPTLPLNIKIIKFYNNHNVAKSLIIHLVSQKNIWKLSVDFYNILRAFKYNCHTNLLSGLKSSWQEMLTYVTYSLPCLCQINLTNSVNDSIAFLSLLPPYSVNIFFLNYLDKT